jgi:hypothetical protein
MRRLHLPCACRLPSRQIQQRRGYRRRAPWTWEREREKERGRGGWDRRRDRRGSEEGVRRGSEDIRERERVWEACAADSEKIREDSTAAAFFFNFWYRLVTPIGTKDLNNL